MFSCLPTPKIYSLGVHSYCLPSDCLMHHLSYGYKAAFFKADPPPQYTLMSNSVLMESRLAQVKRALMLWLR